MFTHEPFSGFVIATVLCSIFLKYCIMGAAKISGNREWGIGNRKSEIGSRNRESGVGNRESGVGSWESAGINAWRLPKAFSFALLFAVFA